LKDRRGLHGLRRRWRPENSALVVGCGVVVVVVGAAVAVAVAVVAVVVGN